MARVYSKGYECLIKLPRGLDRPTVGLPGMWGRNHCQVRTVRTLHWVCELLSGGMPMDAVLMRMVSNECGHSEGPYHDCAYVERRNRMIDVVANAVTAELGHPLSYEKEIAWGAAFLRTMTYVMGGG